MVPMMQKSISDITIVNPLTLEEKDLVRLAALIDGEGMISLHGWNTNKPTCNTLMPIIKFFNSNVELTEHVIGIFNRLGVKSFIETARKKKTHKFVYKVSVIGVSRTFKVLSVLKQYLIAKKAQADIVLEFCEIRMLAAKYGRGKNARYGQREFELKQQIEILNRRGVSETENCEPRQFITAGA